MTKFFLLNVVLLAADGWRYFCNMWNWVDLIVIGGGSVFVVDVFADFLGNSIQNCLGSVVVLAFVFKLIYYLRAFEDYAIFIRMVLEMIGAPELIQFWLMLAVCISGFASFIIVLNYNRGTEG